MNERHLNMIRLIDGEMAEDERRLFLQELDRESPESWRDLALGFVENQMITEALQNQAQAQKSEPIAVKKTSFWSPEGKPISAEDIGIITPYRAQIAGIKHYLEKRVEGFDGITVDTVERYQGGARNIIIISLCLNSVRQLDNLVSMTDDGKVDRKLNVALTRARQHLVVLGNERVMTQSPIFESLVRFISDQEGKFIH